MPQSRGAEPSCTCGLQPGHQGPLLYEPGSRAEAKGGGGTGKSKTLLLEIQYSKWMLDNEATLWDSMVEQEGDCSSVFIGKCLGQVQQRGWTGMDWETPWLLGVKCFLKYPYYFLYGCSCKLQVKFTLKGKEAVEDKRLECICRREKWILLPSPSLQLPVFPVPKPPALYGATEAHPVKLPDRFHGTHVISHILKPLRT